MTTTRLLGDLYRITGRPGGVSRYPRAWYIGQFREFQFPRVHTRMISSEGCFSCEQIDLWKAREHELKNIP